MKYIYLTTNLVNNKKYIGQHTGKVDDNYLGSGIYLLKAIKNMENKILKKKFWKNVFHNRLLIRQKNGGLKFLMR